MSRKRWLGILLTVVILGVLALPKIFQQPKSAKKAGGPPPAVSISVFTASYQTLQRSVYSNGTLMADESAVLLPEVQGRVESVLFEEGQQVSKGTLLLKLNDFEWRAQKARLEAMQKLKKETLKRNQNLLEKGAISQEVYDQSLTDLQVNEAELLVIQENIRKTEIKAPFSGTVGLRNVSEGAVVTPATQVATLQKTDRLKLEFQVSERYVSYLKTGARVHFVLDAYRDTFEATVYAIEPKVDEVTRDIRVRALGKPYGGKLLPGTFARVMVNLTENTEALMVPTQSVVPILKGQKVYIVQGDSVVDRPVSIGLRNDQMVEVTSGLKPGELIVEKGIIYMRPGVKVKYNKSGL